MVACRYGLSLVVLNSTSHSWAIELNTRREIPYLRAPIYYSLFLYLKTSESSHADVTFIKFFQSHLSDVHSSDFFLQWKREAAWTGHAVFANFWVYVSHIIFNFLICMSIIDYMIYCLCNSQHWYLVVPYWNSVFGESLAICYLFLVW